MLNRTEAGARAWCLYIHADASLSLMGARAKAWCLRIHVEACLSLFLCWAAFKLWFQFSLAPLLHGGGLEDEPLASTILAGKLAVADVSHAQEAIYGKYTPDPPYTELPHTELLVKVMHARMMVNVLCNVLSRNQSAMRANQSIEESERTRDVPSVIQE